MPKIIISPSFLGIPGTVQLKRFLAAVEQNGAQRVHVDFGDGQFIPEKSANDILYHIGYLSQLPQDLHLMVDQPQGFLESIFRNWSADNISSCDGTYIIIHQEAAGYHPKFFQRISKHGFLPGLALNPDTAVAKVAEQLFSRLSLIVVMTVVPGKSGQTMIEACLNKVRQLAVIRSGGNHAFKIMVDGGVNGQNIKLVIEAGADIAVSGGYVQKDPRRIIKLLDPK